MATKAPCLKGVQGGHGAPFLNVLDQELVLHGWHCQKSTLLVVPVVLTESHSVLMYWKQLVPILTTKAPSPKLVQVGHDIHILKGLGQELVLLGLNLQFHCLESGEITREVKL